MKSKFGAKILLLAVGFSGFYLTVIKKPSVVFADETKFLEISAIVPPRQSDFQFNFALDDSEKTGNDMLSYKVTYGAKPSAAFQTNNIITADWASEKVNDQAFTYEYASGSATKSFGNSAPAIDIKNHSIVWKAALPAGTLNQIIRFKFRKNNDYGAMANSTFTIRVTIKNQYIKLADQTITYISLPRISYLKEKTPNQSESIQNLLLR